MARVSFLYHLQNSNLTITVSADVLASVLETKAGLSVRDRQLLVRTSNFLHISLQIMFEFLKILIRTGNFLSLALNTAWHYWCLGVQWLLQC